MAVPQPIDPYDAWLAVNVWRERDRLDLSNRLHAAQGEGEAPAEPESPENVEIIAGSGSAGASPLPCAQLNVSLTHEYIGLYHVTSGQKHGLQLE